MSGINKAIIVGNLGADPELRFGQSGNPMCTFSIATSKQWTDKDGNKQERTTWHKIVVWGKQAEPCGEYLHKGAQAYVEGEIETRKYQDKQGIDRYVTEIKAQQVRFLDSKQTQQGREHAQPEMQGYGDSTGYSERDMPF